MTVLAVLFACGAGVAMAADLPDFCDVGLQVRSDDDSAYQHYSDSGEDYCEGHYVDEVSGSSLSVGSLTARGSALPSDKSEWIDLAWGGDAGVLQLRAESLRPKTLYRMDARAKQRFHWSTRRMLEGGVKPSEIGVIALDPSQGRAVYVPVRLTAEGVAETQAGTRLVIVPHKPLDQMFVSVIELDSEDESAEGRVVRRAAPLKESYYAAERPVVIDLPELEAPGRLYRIEIGAITTIGGRTTRDLLIRLAND